MATLAVLLLVFAGEGSAQVPQRAHDPPGVTVVQIPDRLRPGSARWSVSPEPVLVLGEMGSGVDLLGVTSAVVLPDHRIAVADDGSDRILVFNNEGRLLAAHGRNGEGPGEFQRPVIAESLGPDTLVIVDSHLRRLSLVHAGDGFLTSSRIGVELGAPVSPRGAFTDGTVVVGGGHSWNFRAGARATAGYSRPLTSYRSMSLNGSLVTDFGEFPGMEINITVIDLPGGETSMSADAIPFGKRPVTGVGPDRFFIATNESWEIRAFDADGVLKEILRLDRELLSVRDSDVEAKLQEAIDDAGDPAAAPRIRREFAHLPIPVTMPALSSILVGVRGLLWVERYRRPGESGSVYDVIDPSGSLVTEISLPQGNRLLQVGEDFLLTLHEDDLEVETVRMHRLSRGE